MKQSTYAVRCAVRRVLARSGALGGIALLGTALPFGTTIAQEEDSAVLEEIVVTGPAIKRANLDSALPIQTITQDEFKREGVTNAGDLIAKVPAMQGFLTESDSVGGIRTANLRAIGSQYTLSLLDGRRMAPADSGSSIDLSNIPLAAVDQVQILTDGASALYGSDAIAGVVNFVLKDEVDGTTVSMRTDRPQEEGGEHSRARSGRRVRGNAAAAHGHVRDHGFRALRRHIRSIGRAGR